MDKEQLRDAYKGKILAVRNYADDQQEFFVVDFEDKDQLDKVLGEVATGESDITPAGKDFLDTFYGFDALAAALFAKRGFMRAELGAQTPEGIAMWLREIEPMAARSLIENASGMIDSEEPLRDDLLPPR